MKIICIGNAAYDVTLALDHFPIENKKTRLENSRIECGGGSASNCAYLLAKWGMETYFGGVVGDDYYGNKIIEEYEKIGVKTKYLQKKADVPTTTSFIIANTSTGTRTILTDKRKNMVMDKMEVDDKFDIILLDGYEKEFALEVMKKNPKAIKIIDAGSMRESTLELARMVDYIVCSHDFAEEYTKKQIDFNDMRTLIDIYDDLKKDFDQKIIITLEDKGCFTYDNGYKMVPSIKVESIDSTGAGDIYHGAFTYCVANNYDIITTMRMANIAGALSVTKVGSRFSIFALEEVQKKYDELTL